MSSDLPVDLDALRRFHTGESDAREAAEISHWISASPRNAEIASALKPGARDIFPSSEWNARKAYDTVMARAAVSFASSRSRDTGHVSSSPRTVDTRFRTQRGTFARRFGYVAGISAAFLVGFIGYRGYQTIKNSSAGISAPAIAEAMTTHAGERAELTLRDGTHVVLAPGTKIRFDDNFNTTARQVFLDGEAVFDVVNSTGNPFIVRTPQTQVTVLGTRFGVRSYEGDKNTRVVVESGKVSVGTKQVLTAGTAAVADVSGAITFEPRVDADTELAWTDGNLVFENATVSSVLARLSRWYGVTFQLDDTQLANTRVKVGFSRVDIQQAINLLTTVLGVEATRSGRVVTLHVRR